MKYLQSLTLAAAALALPAAAADFSRVQTLTQAEFATLARDFAGLASYRGVSPAEPLGVVGFDVGASLGATRLDNAGVWRKAGYDRSSVYLPRLNVQKGLPFGIDVGASVVAAPDSDIKLLGAELKYAIVPGGVATPAVAVRAAATRLSGVSQLDLDTHSLELTVSKGFLMLTPYAGVGRVWGALTPNVAGLREEKTNAGKVFAGVNVNLGLLNVAGEIDRTGDNRTVSVKLGFRL